MKRLLLAALCTLAVPCVAPASAQVVEVPASAGAGLYIERYDFLAPGAIGIERVSLLTTPIAARIPVMDRIGLEVGGGFARGSMLTESGEEIELSGLTDTQIRANFAVIPERLTVSLGVLAPTGKATQTLPQTQLAGLVAADLLPFRISSWGTGGGIGLATAYAMPLGDFNFGVSAGYTMGREFDPIEGDERQYRPGSEVRLRLALDRVIGTSGQASLVAGVQRYADDQIGGESIYQPGDRLEALASYLFAAGARGSGALYAGIQHRGEGRLTAADVTTPAQDLITAGGGVRLPLGAATFVPSVDLRIFRRSDGLGQGVLTSLGANTEIPVGQGVMVIPSLRTRFGDVLLWEEAETSLRGFELGLGLRVGG